MTGRTVNPHPTTEPCCWTPGMTEREFFNANLRCGTPGFYPFKEYTREIRPLHIGVNGRPGCGAANWRVFRQAWMHRGERELVCLMQHRGVARGRAVHDHGSFTLYRHHDFEFDTLENHAVYVNERVERFDQRRGILGQSAPFVRAAIDAAIASQPPAAAAEHKTDTSGRPNQP